MQNISLQLGDVTFADFEIPESISVGGSQMLRLHKLVGGVRVIDSMGRDDAPLAWSGTFMGTNAVARAQALDALRVAGGQLLLTFGQYRYQVVIGDFRANLQRPYLIPYTISCEVVADQSVQTVAQDSPTVDDAIDSDLSDAQDDSDTIGDPTLTGLMATLQSAAAAVQTFANAAQSVIASVANPLQAVQGRIATLLTAQVSLQASGSFAGITVGASVSSASALSVQITVNTNLQTLYGLQNTLGRVANNLAAITESPNTVTVGGGNLFQLADQAYGDPTDWTAIASANGLSDPFVTGPVTLVIPTAAPASGGVLDA